ncbi:MAG: hypothetical protein M1817_005275 [Caeruleum heppii]|nr:MAG: hypothetical protein M1817_005275 [Caeruleum heppii]
MSVRSHNIREEHRLSITRAKVAMIDEILQEEDAPQGRHRQRNCDDAILNDPKYAIPTSHPITLSLQGTKLFLITTNIVLTVTRAFQRLGFAFEILRSPSSRRTYDKASKPACFPRPTNPGNFLGGEHTFRSAVEAILHEFMTGDFALVRKGLESLNRQYPNLVSEEVVVTVERSFIRIRELVLTTRTYALLTYIELGRIHRVQKRLMSLGYLDVLGRVRLTVQLVRVTLAVPVRVDRALKHKEERDWRAKAAGLYASGLPLPNATPRAGFLNERVSQVLEYIVGEAGEDRDLDEAWGPYHSSSSPQKPPEHPG